MVGPVDRLTGVALGLAETPDRKGRKQDDCEEHGQFGIAVEYGQHQPHLRKRFHSAFPFPERDELGDSASNTGTRPAGKLCMHICSRVQRFPLAVFPHDHFARLIDSLSGRDPETLIETVMNEVIETGGEYILPPDRHAENALWAIRLHGEFAIGTSELDAICKWRATAMAACLNAQQSTSSAGAELARAEA